jgi:effector-binding domain-containing protein
MSEREIEIKKVPAVRVASFQAKGLPFNVTIPKAYEELAKWMDSKKIPMPTGSPMGLALYYDDPKSVKPEEVKFKVAIPVSPETPEIAEGKAAVEELPACEVAYLTIRGPYTNLEDAYNQLFGWVYKSGYKVTDPSREVYVKWGEEMPPEEWVTEIQVPVGK